MRRSYISLKQRIGGVELQRLKEKRAKAEPLLLAYLKNNPAAKRGSLGEQFGISRHMARRILVDNGIPTKVSWAKTAKRPKQLDLFERRI